jgi:hypothetical protein
MITGEAIGTVPPERPRGHRDPRHRHLYRDHLGDQLPVLVGPRGSFDQWSETTHANHSKPTSPQRHRTGGPPVTTTTSCPSPCPARGPTTTAITWRLTNMSADPREHGADPPTSSASPTRKSSTRPGRSRCRDSRQYPHRPAVQARRRRGADGANPSRLPSGPQRQHRPPGSARHRAELIDGQRIAIAFAGDPTPPIRVSGLQTTNMS